MCICSAQAQAWVLKSPATASEAIQRAPASPDFTPATSLIETLDHVFDSVTALSPVKGFNAAMRLPDGAVWKRARGVAVEVPAAAPLTTDHLMGMGSITKSFVAVTVLRLHEEGLLDLDDSIGQYVGPYPNVPPNTTIRQLLNHRSGISDYINENPAMADAVLTDLDSVWSAGSVLSGYVLTPNFPTDESWSYSNTNYLLAGDILEAVTGQPWYAVVRNRVLEPLGLTHTFAYPWETPGNQPFAHVFADVIGDAQLEDWQGIGLGDAALFSVAGSAGCLITTPEDLVAFSERLYGGHLLAPETLSAMQVDYVDNPDLGFLYGLGALSFPIAGGLENWGHDGDLLYKSVALYFPAENMALAVQQNDDRTYDPEAENPVVDLYIVYGALLEAYLNYLPTALGDAPEAVLPLRAYPNPGSAQLHLELPDDGRITYPAVLHITDMTGKVAATHTLRSSRETIDVSALPSGSYGLRAGSYIRIWMKQ
jgi:D-alanyl-D-alanine carboxypeptidase